MIDTIIFDLDGVLINSKDIHFFCLNKAILKAGVNHQITYEDHVHNFDGLPTITKLKILNKKKIIPANLNKKIQIIKNKYTYRELNKIIKFDRKIYNIFKNLSHKYKIGIATNAIQKTLNLSIKKLKIKKFVKFSISKNFIRNPKPHPEVYLKLILRLNSNPKNTLIIEDSHHGRSAAKDSGAELMPIKNIHEVTYKNIINFIKNKKFVLDKANRQWDDKDLRIVIPMAGQGSRFIDAGYTFPKPLIEVKQKPMIQLVVESLNIKGKYIFLVRKEHIEKYNFKNFLNILAPNCEIVIVDKLTEGAACTVLLAEKFINNNKPLIIANSDQYIEWNSSETMYSFFSSKIDGGILTFKALHPKWSYAKVDKNNQVLEVAEKKVISNNATAGIYYWKKGSDFVKYASDMIRKNFRVNDEFYVCPIYNEAINDKKIIKIKEVNSMWGLGTPEDLKFFQENYKAI